jgi:alcohol dehydrogenase
VLPLVALPTTAGTGSEVTPVAVLADPDRALKVGISSPELIPTVAICDPDLTLGAPATLTAHAGADALTHAIESFTAIRREATSDLSRKAVFVGKNILSDGQATQAIALITRNLERVVANGDDRPAREAMMLGAMLAGLAFGSAGNAAAHALQYPVGALTHTSHGVGVACLMPYVMEYNRSFCPDAMAGIANAMGLPNDGGDRASAAIAAVAALFARIGIPATLRDLGLPEDKLDWTAEQAMSAGRLVNNNPRPLDVAAMKQILRAAYDGDRRLLQAA